MKETARVKPPMAAAKEPTTSIRTGTWRFEKPVFTSRLAPCSEACPMGEDIPAIMALNGRRGFEAAYQKILEENPFPGICGRLCFHPCERVCNRARFDEAVSIRDLERFAFEEAKVKALTATKDRGRESGKVAVLGGGLAGLSCAFFLVRYGYDVTVFEERERLSILDLSGVHTGLIEADLEWETGRILDQGVAVETGVSTGPDVYRGLAEQFRGAYRSPENTQDPSRKVKKPDYHETGLLLLEEEGKDLDSPAADQTRVLVRLMAAGKRAAMALHLGLKQLPTETMEKFAIGRLGAYSMTSSLLGSADHPVRPMGDVIRLEDLNVAHFRKAPRIDPGQGRYAKSQAATSAKRCFHCGICDFCGRCYDYCPDLAIHMDRGTNRREIDYDHCKGCGICAEECPRGAIGWVKE